MTDFQNVYNVALGRTLIILFMKFIPTLPFLNLLIVQISEMICLY